MQADMHAAKMDIPILCPFFAKFTVLRYGVQMDTRGQVHVNLETGGRQAVSLASGHIL